jgi:hypothetical protein
MTQSPFRSCLRSSARRGVLLLVVLSMLTLFLMLGAAYLAMASRSRDIARAFSRLTADSAEARIDHAHFLDATLLTVLRGGTSPQLSSGTARALLTGTANFNFESLLADRYGSNQTLVGAATVTGTTAATPLYTVALTSSSTPHPALLNGRVLTFTPPGGDATSHRILRATGSAGSYTLTIGPPHGRDAFSAPPAGSPAIVNGLEFSSEGPENEEFDGFDMAKNPFLAYVSLSDLPADSICNKMSFIRPLDLGVATDAQIQFETDPATLLPFTADNDNDGEPDGIFLDFGFPKITNAAGQEIQLDASVLIVDLDSRFNVNAHGSLVPRLYQSATGTHAGWSTSGTTATGTIPFGTAASGSNVYVPLGSGYGPAETNGDKIGFSQTFRFSGTVTSATSSPTEWQDPWMFSLLGGGTACQVGKRTFGSRFSYGADTPRMPALTGRLGGSPPSGTSAWDIFGVGTGTFGALTVGKPGRSGTNELVSVTTDQLQAQSGTVQQPSWQYGIPDAWWSGATNVLSGTLERQIYNSPPDLHGRLKVFTGTPAASAAVPTLSLAKPEWGNETTDDPYEVRLGENARRAGSAGADDATFTYAELEKILRPYDIDSQLLPNRLAAILGSTAEEGRLLFTTDSWDTTVITGSAARQIRTWMTGLPTGTTALYGTMSGTTGPVTGALTGELARGEKFDLSRPLQYSKPTVTGSTIYSGTHPYYVQRQAYFKDLFTLLCALTGTTAVPANHRDLAQWAANVVEFVDADSTMTPFEYDPNLADGWQVDGDFNTNTSDYTVFGAERPEVVITEAYAWEHTSSGTTTNSLLVALHRPWEAKLFARTSGSTYETAGEPCDPALTSDASGTTNALAFGKRDASNQYPIWRLRLVRGGTHSIIRFDDDDVAPPAAATDRHALISGTSASLATNTTLLVYGTAAYRNNSGWQPIGVASGSAIEAAITTGSLALPGAPGTATVNIYLERLSDPTAAVTNGTWTANETVTSSTMASGTAGMTITTPMYRIIDSVTIDVDSITGSTSSKKAVRGMSDANTSFWKSIVTKNAALGTFGDAVTTATNAAWFHWPNRPLTSPMELLLVRYGDAATWLDSYERFTSGSNSLISGSNSLISPGTTDSERKSLNLFSAASIPTRFAGIHTTLPANGWTSSHESLTGIHRTIRQVNQLSAYREPGRTNLNTIVGYPDPADPARMQSDVWSAVVAGPLPSPPTLYSGTFAGTLRRKLTQSALPAQPKLGIPATPAVPGRGNKKQDAPNVAGPANPADSLAMAIIRISGTDSYIATIRTGTTITTSTNALMRTAIDRNPWHGIYTAIRLANTATVRSNVFGIWVTLREAIPGDPASVKLHRAFYIVDRSIPVGYEPGKDHNVRDAIRLRRIIE